MPSGGWLVNPLAAPHANHPGIERSTIEFVLRRRDMPLRALRTDVGRQLCCAIAIPAGALSEPDIQWVGLIL